jgi:hypothetical protein
MKHEMAGVLVGVYVVAGEVHRFSPKKDTSSAIMNPQ